MCSKMLRSIDKALPQAEIAGDLRRGSETIQRPSPFLLEQLISLRYLSFGKKLGEN